MNLQSQLSDRLWRAVQNSYENRNFTGAITDAVYFLSALIRDRSGLDSDGVSLVGQAFGGKSPKLRVNKLETESERNVQSGLESILRGVYQAIRNPRSHEKFSDSQNDADAIILFADYLVKVIDQAKPPFTTAELVERVFDADFVESQRYAELLVKRIPAKKRLEVFVEVFRSKETGDQDKLRHFFAALLSAMTEEEKSEALAVVEEELSHATDEATVRATLQVLPSGCFESFDEAVRLRIENKLLKSVEEGQYNVRRQKCEKGAFGTWIGNIAGNLLLKSELVRIVCRKLSVGTDEEKDYVFNFFFRYLDELVPEPDRHLTRVISAGLAVGDKRFKNALSGIMDCGPFGPSKWQECFKKPFEEFKEREFTAPSDEASATTAGGDDIPF